MTSAEIETQPEASRAGGALLYPIAVALGTLALGLAASVSPVAGVIGAVGAGALCVLGKRVFALAIAAGMLGALAVVPAAGVSVGYWALLVLLVAASIARLRISPSLLRIAPATWAVCLVLCAVSIGGLLVGTGILADYFIIQGSLCAALIGAGVTRHLAMVDARLMAWGEEGLSAVTRDLLLGRITSGMLHDLSQPLNVISMANGNLGYIVEHMQADDATRQQLLDRTRRIAVHTEKTAAILTLFRWFGRNDYQEEAGLSVRNALERAIAATRSNVRYHGVEIELGGNALDLLAVRHHGRLEMMAVAALLSALAAYGSPEGERTRGRIVIHAEARARDIAIEFHCADDQDKPVACKPIDNATLWLVEQVAQEAGGDFRCYAGRKGKIRFALHLAREDV